MANANAHSQALAWLQASEPTPALSIPATVEEWMTQRAAIRSQLWQMLGDLPPRPAVPSARILSRETHPHYALETFEFENGAGEAVRGHCFLPVTASATAKAPAILYCHWHGGEYRVGKNELLLTNAVPVAPGPALAKLGFVVLGIDASGFGDRNGKGPDGPKQRGIQGELTAAKFHLWMGRSLWGMMMRDDLMALDYLAARPEVDAGRIGVTGISMGSTRAWWLMALDDRLRTAVCVACMTRYQELIRSGQLKAHGLYYFVPGMLKHFDTEAVLACAAPRPLLFMTGDSDLGSPIEGVRKLGGVLEKVYALHGHEARGHFENLIYQGTGHTYLPDMWEKTTAWMQRQLSP